MAMTIVHGFESAWLAREVAQRRALLVSYRTALGAIVIGAAVWNPALAVGLFAVGFLLAGGRQCVGRRYRHAKQGAAGQAATATMLALLPAGFVVVNDLEFDGFNVDHVVVGDTGIWAIETKSQSGNVHERAEGVWLDGNRMYRDPRRQACASAAAVANLIRRSTGTGTGSKTWSAFPGRRCARTCSRPRHVSSTLAGCWRGSGWDRSACRPGSGIGSSMRSGDTRGSS